jgi:integrase
MSITNSTCKDAKPRGKPYKLVDRDNLYLLVAVAGSKTWKWGYRLPDPVSGKSRQHEATLGQFPDVDVYEARKRRARAAEVVERGEHPLKPKRVAPVAAIPDSLTVWAAVSGWMALRATEWSASYAKQVDTYMRLYAGPETALGGRPYASVTRPELFELIEGIGKTAPAVARLVKQWLTAAFDRLVDSGRLEHSPLAGMRTRSAVPTSKTVNSPWLQAPALRSLLLDIRHYGQRRMAIMLELLARTCVRSSELRCADWQEFDLEAGLWVIPADRMKMRTLHVVPLPAQVVTLLRELQEFEGGKGLLFPNDNNPLVPMAQSSPREALYRLSKREFSPHGFRSTFSTHAHEAGKPPHLIEAALAHQQRNRTASAYNKSTYVEDRRTLMAWWSAELDKLINSQFEKIEELANAA